jgi:phosphatidylserine decarboxylase
MVGYRLGMISRAGGDHPTLLFAFGQQENPVESTALFEGSRALEIIQLEIDLLTGHPGEIGRELARGKVDEVANPLFCLLYLGEGNFHRWHSPVAMALEKDIATGAKKP